MKAAPAPMRRSESLMRLVVVRRAWKQYRADTLWVAFCRAPRCKFSEIHPTHNGAHIAAARHRREKAFNKLHGATPLEAAS